MSHSTILSVAILVIAVDAPPMTASNADSVVMGVFGGGIVSNGGLAIGDVELPEGWAPSIGARLGYFPRWYFGLELEGSGTVFRGEQPVSLWDTRGSLVGKLGLWTVSPFVLLGGGAIGLANGDAGPSFHVGGGLEASVARRGQIRVDVRDVMAPSTDGHTESHNLVVTFGIAVAFRGLPPLSWAS